jgi:hypothetical protein
MVRLLFTAIIRVYALFHKTNFPHQTMLYTRRPTPFRGPLNPFVPVADLEDLLVPVAHQN